MSNLGDQTVDKNGSSLYFSTRNNEYLSLSLFCSEEFLCTSCLRDNNELKRGTVRYDSLVLCDVHNERFKPIMRKLVNAIESCAGVTVITDLGV